MRSQRTRRKASSIQASWSIWQYIAAILLLGYAALLVYWMFWGFGRVAPDTNTPYRYNWIPLRTIYEFATMKVGTRLDQWINLLGNVAVFVPFGLLIPFVFRVRWLSFIIRFASGILILELLQLITRRGTADIDDIILNTIGACIGYAVIEIIVGWRRRSKKMNRGR